MSLRWKYTIVVIAALLATAAGFWLAHQLGFWPESDAALVASVLVVAGSIALVLGAAFRSFLDRPVRTIVESTRRVVDGATGIRIELDQHDEMEEIAEAVNQLVVHHESKQSDLELEMRVQREDLHAVLEEVAERDEIHEEVHERLADADRRKMSFLTNVSHELRTPLTSIIGFLELLEERMYDSDEEREEFFDNSRFALGHMLHVLDVVLQAARLDRGALKPAPRAIATGDAVLEVFRILDAARRENQLELRIEAPGCGLIFADELLLRQVLINLVGNAIKFTEQGSVTVRVAEEDDFIRVEVADTGEGIDPAALDEIFLRFHQGESETSRAKGGIGLGLALSRELIEMMGGTLGGRSDGPGTGACFYFTLPAATATLPA